tara:strand:- start:870 stop:1007 length:138 start_codon:yes stop_codon:yes gene_type:complete
MNIALISTLTTAVAAVVGKTVFKTVKPKKQLQVVRTAEIYSQEPS